MPHVIKKKDYDNLVKATRYLEKALVLMERAERSSPVIGYAPEFNETLAYVRWCETALRSDIKDFKTK